jgi:SAM-dependent methyltransferase
VTVRRLDRVDEPVPSEGIGGPDHPMRRVTRQVAFDPAGWDADRAAKVAALFDDLAGEWHTRGGPARDALLVDALDRGEVSGHRGLELGSGVGMASPLLAARFDVVVATDLSAEMLRLAPAEPPRVRADAQHLPFPGGAFDVVVLQNMLLFPLEMERIVAPGGCLVWVNSVGDRTPIHLPAEDVDRAMGDGWDTVASAHGPGTWAVARRASAA